MKPVDHPEIVDWFRHASEDERTAELVFPHGLFDTVAFHSQQAAEKRLKSVMVAVGLQPPYVHDLRVLIDRLALSGVVFVGIDHLADPLTAHAVRSRYPGFGDLTQAEAREAIEAAAAIRAAVLAVFAAAKI